MLSRASLARLPRLISRTTTRAYAANPTANDPAHETRPVKPNVSATNELPLDAMGNKDGTIQESVAKGEELVAKQAPNRVGVWSSSQQPRERAMVGPRFEQTIMEDQPRPLAAIELIHKQPVRWVHARKVSCDGGGGPLGHPRIFINLDKAEITECTYCGLPFAYDHNRKAIEAQPRHPYPLAPQGHPAEVAESQRITDEPLGQR